MFIKTTRDIYEKFRRKDVHPCQALFLFPFSFGSIPMMLKVVSNDPYTVIYFADGSKVTVKCDGNTKFDAEKGIYIALLKKALGGRNLHCLFKMIEPELSQPSDTAETSFSADENGIWHETTDSSAPKKRCCGACNKNTDDRPFGKMTDADYEVMKAAEESARTAHETGLYDEFTDAGPET